jgi:hypothetical protein
VCQLKSLPKDVIFTGPTEEGVQFAITPREEWIAQTVLGELPYIIDAITLVH